MEKYEYHYLHEKGVFCHHNLGCTSIYRSLFHPLIWMLSSLFTLGWTCWSYSSEFGQQCWQLSQGKLGHSSIASYLKVNMASSVGRYLKVNMASSSSSYLKVNMASSVGSYLRVNLASSVGSYLKVNMTSSVDSYPKVNIASSVASYFKVNMASSVAK